jgi:hypothetical protein
MVPVTEEQIQGPVVSAAETTASTSQLETHAAEMDNDFDEEALDGGGGEGRPRSHTKRRLLGIRILKNLSLFKRRKR